MRQLAAGPLVVTSMNHRLAVLFLSLATAVLADAPYWRAPAGPNAGALGPRASWPRVAVARSSDGGPHLPAGERVIATIEVGSWPAPARSLAAGGEAPIEVPLVIPGVLPPGVAPAAARVAVLRVGALEIPDGVRGDGPASVPSAGFVMDLKAEGTSLVVPCPVAHSGGEDARLYILDHSRSVEWTPAPRLTADPLDAEPLGDRDPVVLVHGMSNTDLTAGDHDPGKIAIFDPLRADPGYRALMARAKFYRYEYPTYRSTRENGEALAGLIERTVGEAALARGRLVLVGHSMGGLVVRHAMATRDLGRHVRLAVTVATPHHGSGGASLVYANAKIAERIGVFWAVVARFAAAYSPDTPGQRDVAWDNLDGAIPAADAARYGLYVNEPLAEFNRAGRYADRVSCVMGDVESLWVTTNPQRILYDMVRRGQGAYHATWATSDPLVCRDSGAFANGATMGVSLLPGLDHGEVMTSAPGVQSLLRLLRGSALP
jgi:hypothetical protein